MATTNQTLPCRTDSVHRSRWMEVGNNLSWHSMGEASSGLLPADEVECANVVKKMAHAEGLTGTVQNDGVC